MNGGHIVKSKSKFLENARLRNEVISHRNYQFELGRALVVPLKESLDEARSAGVPAEHAKASENMLIIHNYSQKNLKFMLERVTEKDGLAYALCLVLDENRLNEVKSLIWAQLDMDSFASVALTSFFNDGTIPRSRPDDEASHLENQYSHYSDNSKLSDDAATLVISLAMTDPYCWEYAISWASSYLMMGEEMPEALSRFAIHALNEGKKPKKVGVHSEVPFWRDLSIKILAEVMQRRFHSPLEANAASGGESIGKAIAHALGKHRESISESVVRKIALRPWAKFGELGEVVGKCLSDHFPTQRQARLAK